MVFVAKVRHNFYQLGLTSLLAVREMPTQQAIRIYFLRAKDVIGCVVSITIMLSDSNPHNF